MLINLLKTMTLEARKYELIDWITEINDEDIISFLESLKKSRSETWNDLPKHVQNGILKSIEQADRGEFISNEAVFEKYRKTSR